MPLSQQAKREIAWSRFEDQLRRWAWIGPIACLAVIYYVVNQFLPRVLSGGLNIYVVQPLLWSTLTVVAYLVYSYSIQYKPSLSRPVATMALGVGLFQVALLVTAGLIFGFGYSPFARDPLPMLGNLVYLTAMLLAVEITRAFVTAYLSSRNQYLALIIPTVLLTLIAIPVARFSLAGDPRSWIALSGETVLPALGENLLATYLVMLGGPAAALLYRGLLLAFEWLSPVLPNLDPMVAAFVGTVAPILSLVVLSGQLSGTDPRGSPSTASRESNSAGSIVIGIIAVTLIWFNTGLFGMQPTLVSGVSMEPALRPGDVVITRETPTSEISAGDIIRFRIGGSYVLHRVLRVETAEGRPVFVTKGDANNTVDPAVLESQVEGKVVAVVPKVGWIGIAARSLMEWLR